jgi:protease-4
MKSKWYALGCLTSLVLVIGVILFSILSLSRMGKTFSSQPIKIAEGSILHIKAQGEIAAYNEFEDNLWKTTNESVHDLVQKIDYAAQDSRIQAIFLEPQYLNAGYADLNEIIAALKRFRQSGKQVVSYLDFALNRDYFLASAADTVVLNPSASAGILLSGVGGNILFYKDIFDKIGLEFTVLTAGEYKGAGETFVRTAFSEPVRKNLIRLYDNFYDTIVYRLAENRNLSIQEIKNIYEKRKELFLNRQKALELHLVDELHTREDMLHSRGWQNKLISSSDYRYLQPTTSQNHIAVVYLQGSIMPGTDSFMQTGINDVKFDKILADISKNQQVKAIVLRVDSPGGSALVSENIAAALEKLKGQKPLVVSMGNVAASGGYYISALADRIFVDPFTLTGSIGVVSMIPNLESMAGKVGISSEKIGKGKFSSALDLYSRPTAEEIAGWQITLNDTYMEFKTRVSQGRNIPLADVEKAAQGQVWNSTDAVDYNLADETGMLQDALKSAAELAGISDFRAVYYPKQKNLLEELLRKRLNFSVSQVLKKSIFEEMKMREMDNLYDSIKRHPIQMILPFRIETN